MISTIKYLVNLRTECTHLKSGEKFITDAPTDNNGKGEAFSPTDMIATNLGTCMLTLMGIKANNLGIEFSGATVEVEKIMAANPRRISEIKLKIRIPLVYDKETRNSLERAAINCPVAKSLHPDIKQNVKFKWAKKD